MNFDLTEEQRGLQDSVDRLVARNYNPEQRLAIARSAQGWSREMWQQYAEIGLLGMSFAEADGGFGGGAIEQMIAMEILGRGLVLEPYVSSAILCGAALRLAPASEIRSRLIESSIDGSILVAIAHGEAQARYDLGNVRATAVRVDGGWRLQGRKTLVLHGESAQRFIVSARIEVSSEGHFALFVVDGALDAIKRRSYRLLDGSMAADVEFQDVLIPVDGLLVDAADGLNVLSHAWDVTCAALAAEAVGIMDAIHRLTVEYLRTRKQFGVSIGSFQALQHRAVDMLVHLEQARSMAMYAAVMSDETHVRERERAISAAKVRVSAAGRFVAQQAIQLHGGIGMTLEYQLGHYARRLQTIDALFGDPTYHLHRLAAHGGLFDIAAEDVALLDGECVA